MPLNVRLLFHECIAFIELIITMIFQKNICEKNVFSLLKKRRGEEDFYCNTENLYIYITL